MSLFLPSLFRQIREAQDRSDRIWDPVIGIVVDNKDPKKLGRIKVRFPTLPGIDTSTWAPIAAVGAGKDRGWWFLPEKSKSDTELGDEVLVMFEHGDIERPVVIGALWNGIDLPPDKNEGTNERRVLVSREGSRVTFDDDKGTVTLEDGKGFGRIEISADNKITIEALQGDVCIQAPKGEIGVVAKQIQITASKTAHIQTGGSLAMQSGAAMTFKASNLTANAENSEFNEGSPAPADKAVARCEDVPDPLK